MQSASALMFEVAVSRLLAIRFWHHYAFLIISCALLGYSMAGVVLLLLRRRFSPVIPSCCFAFSLVPLLIGFQSLPFDPALLFIEPVQWVWLGFHYVVLALPFFFGGLTLNQLLQQFSGKAYALYSADLCGAAVGAIAFFPIASHWQEMEWLVFVTVSGTGAAMCLASTWRVRLGVLCALLTALSLGNYWGMPEWKMSPYKSLPLALQSSFSTPIRTASDAVSRIDWFNSPIARTAPGLSLNYLGPLPEQEGITIDGDQLTSYTPWQQGTGNDLAPSVSADYLANLPSWLIYQIPPAPQSVLILQVIGGQEVLSAVKSGADPIVVQTDTALLGDWLQSQNPWPHVEIRPERVRTTLARNPSRFDRIVVNLEGASPTGASGTDALQQAHLETVEGVTQMLDHLNPEGWLSVHRYLLPPPRAELRWVSTLIEVMKRRGWNPAQQLGVFRTVSTFMILVSAQEWTPEQQILFREFCEQRGFTPVYYPGMPPDMTNQSNRFSTPIYATPIWQMLESDKTFHQQSLYDLSPVEDDQPFFYDFLKWSKLRETYEHMGYRWDGLVEGGLLLPFLLLQLLGITSLLIGLPLLVFRRSRKLLSREISYFFWIGLGFMIVEIALFEKLILFLGEPVYSFATVLAGLLFASGVGSGVSSLLHRRYRQWDQWGFWGLIIVLILYFFALSQLLQMFAGSDFSIRLFVALLGVSGIGFLLGIPFPQGIVRLNQNASENTVDQRVALAWCFNGMGSVLGPVLALLLAQMTGLSSLFFWAALCYAIARLIFRRASNPL